MKPDFGNIPTTPEEKAFIKSLESNSQLVDVTDEQDVSKLPPPITHVRTPDGRVRRIRFTSSFSPR